MTRSHPIEIGGRFVGVAVQASTDWQFVAIDARLGDLHGASFPSTAEAARVARLVFTRVTALPPVTAGLAGEGRCHA